MSQRPLLLAALAAFVLAGCSSMQSFYSDSVDAGAQLGLLPDHQLQRANHYVFPLQAGFYISWSDPHPVKADAGTAAGLAADTAALLYQQLAAHFPRVELAASAQTPELARVAAVRQHLEYLIYPRVLLLHDSVGSGRSMAYASGTTGMQPATGLAQDRAELQLTVVEAVTGRIVDVVNLDSASGLFAMPGRSPRQLLQSALDRYVVSIFPRS